MTVDRKFVIGADTHRADGAQDGMSGQWRQLPADRWNDARIAATIGAPDAVAKAKADDRIAIADGADFIVADANTAPVEAQPIPDQQAIEETAFTFTVPAGTFSDDQDTIFNYSVMQDDGSPLPVWLTFDAATRTFTGTPSNEDINGGEGSAIDVKIAATDSGGLTGYTVFRLHLVNVNDAPTVDNPIADQQASEGAVFSFAVPANSFGDVDRENGLMLSATRSDGTALPAWLVFDPNTETFSGTPGNGDVGTLSVTVTATDNDGASTSDSFDIQVGNVNEAPTVANEIAAQTATEEELFSFTVPAGTFADVDAGDTLTYRAVMDDAEGSALPDWLHFDGTTLTGTPSNDVVKADNGFDVKLIATDSGGLSASTVFRLNLANAPDAPTLDNEIPDQQAAEGSLFTFTVPYGTFSDVDRENGLMLTARLADGSPLPGWLIFDPNSETFTGTPDNGDVGTLSITVTARDNDQLSVSDTFDIVVANANTAPAEAQPIADQQAIEETAFSFTVPAGTFSDDQDTSFNYSVMQDDGSPLPVWLTFDAATRTFTGTPSNEDINGGEGSAIDVKIAATDSGGLTGYTVFRLHLVNVNDAPTVANPIADQQASEGNAFSFAIPYGTFHDVDRENGVMLSATLAGGAPLPSWLVFDPNSETFSGTPGNGDAGTVSITVTGRDNDGATTSDSFDIVVADGNSAPTDISLSANSAAENAAGAVIGTLGTVDPDAGDSFSYAVVGDSPFEVATGAGGVATLKLKNGVALDHETADKVAVTIVSTDSGGLSTQKSFTINVTNMVENQTVSMAALSTTIFLAPSSDHWTVNGTLQSDEITTFGGTDTVQGGGGADIIDTGGGADIIVGGTGDDMLRGGGGADRFEVAAGAGVDSYDGGADADQILVTASNSVLGIRSLAGIEAINTAKGVAGVSIGGSPLADILDFSGVTIARTITGINAGSGNDIVNGSAGVDVITGGAGQDMLSGGAGSDRFVYTSASDSVVGAADVITDFLRAQGDKIDLSGIDAIAGTSKNEAFGFIGAGAFTGVAGQLRAAIDGGGAAFIQGDVNGDRVADFEIRLDDPLALAAKDFVL